MFCPPLTDNNDNKDNWAITKVPMMPPPNPNGLNSVHLVPYKCVLPVRIVLAGNIGTVQ